MQTAFFYLLLTKLLLQSPHVVDNAPDLGIWNFLVIGRHFASSLLGLIEHFTIGVTLEGST